MRKRKANYELTWQEAKEIAKKNLLPTIIVWNRYKKLGWAKSKLGKPLCYHFKAETMASKLRKLGIETGLFYSRLSRGWTIPQALRARKLGSFEKYKLFGVPLFDLWTTFGYKYCPNLKTIEHRLEKGWDLKKALTTPMDVKYVSKEFKEKYEKIEPYICKEPFEINCDYDIRNYIFKEKYGCSLPMYYKIKQNFGGDEIATLKYIKKHYEPKPKIKELWDFAMETLEDKKEYRVKYNKGEKKNTKHTKYKINGVSLWDKCKEKGVNYSTIFQRLMRKPDSTEEELFAERV